MTKLKEHIRKVFTQEGKLESLEKNRQDYPTTSTGGVFQASVLFSMRLEHDILASFGAFYRKFTRFLVYFFMPK